jgi:hypothetical protein
MLPGIAAALNATSWLFLVSSHSLQEWREAGLIVEHFTDSILNLRMAGGEIQAQTNHTLYTVVCWCTKMSHLGVVCKVVNQSLGKLFQLE